MVVTRSSPSAHAIPALPPKRRLSLTPLSPNISLLAEESNASMAKESYRPNLESTPSTVSTNKRPPRNPSVSSGSGSALVGKTKSIKPEAGTPTSDRLENENTKKPKIHYLDDEDALMFPDPPTPVEVNSIKAAAAKLLESRAKRRRSLPVLLESDRREMVSCVDTTNTIKRISHQSPASISNMNDNTKSISSMEKCDLFPASISNIHDNTKGISSIEKCDSLKLKKTQDDFGGNIYNVSSTNTVQETHFSICFDDSGDEDFDKDIHRNKKLHGRADDKGISVSWTSDLINSNALGLGAAEATLESTDVPTESFPSKYHKGKNRRSILLPSDAGYDQFHGVKSADNNGLINSFPSTAYESKSTKQLEPKQNLTLLKCQKPDTYDEKLDRVKKAVRKLCNLPLEKRYLSEEVTLIEELSGYPILNPIEKSRRAYLALKGSSSTEDSNLIVGKTISEEMENFTAQQPSDEMKVQLISRLSPYLEFLEEKRKEDTDALEKSTGYRVAKGKNGRFVYSHIKKGHSICPKEYERAYRSAHIRISPLDDAPRPIPPLALANNTETVSRPSSYTDDDNLMAIDLCNVLQRFHRPTSSNPFIADAQRRLYVAVHSALHQYQNEVTVHMEMQK